MKNLFIDSNIWLSLYHFTNDDLAQFSKLKELIGKDIKLIIPIQVCDEVQRNREAKIKDAFKTFEVKSISFPAFCKGYEEYEQFQSDYKEIFRRYKAWMAKINADIQNQNLPADIAIQDFFNATELIACDSVVDKAYKRYRIGNPPGKDNKYGDAINWECLLEAIPDGEDLYLISSDKDYRSDMFDNMLNPFLANEWRSKKNSNIFFYKNLVPFLSEHFKDIKLRTEQEKQTLIARLNSSHNFETTHGIIAMLDKHSGWTESQIEELCQAVQSNNQVGWILGDIDVLNFYANLLSKVKYEELPPSATKEVMDAVFSIDADCYAQQYEDARTECLEALENYYNH